MKEVISTFLILFMGYSAFAIEEEHPATHYTNGVGIEYKKTLDEYVSAYVGTHLVYYEANTCSQGDKLFQKKSGGYYRTVPYLLESITMKDDVLSFTLKNETNGLKIVLPVINRDE